MAKVNASNLSDVVAKELDKYAEDVDVELEEIIETVAKKGAQALKNDSLAKFKAHGGKRYGSGWSAQVDKGRMKTEGVIYNRLFPGLPHLLENGHAKRGGGRVSGVEHIKPVEDMVIDLVTKEVEKRL